MLQTHTANDFFMQEVYKHGWEYADGLIAEGYEPTLVNGVWCWRKPNSLNKLNGLSSTSTLIGAKDQTPKVPIRA